GPESPISITNGADELAMKRKGFTLVEMMIVVALLVVLVVAGNRMFFSVLKGSTKADKLALVKQNGDYALNIMQRMIRNARSLKECTVSTVEIDNPDPMAPPEKRWTKFILDTTNHYVASESSTLSGADARLTGTQVWLTAGSFACTSGADGEPDQVEINFTLEQAGTTNRPEEKAAASFHTTVVMRNID
ncbi:hypothetical protein COU97_01495, partial [Candidatus Shapirobacteria bacterium CG10_big_fil_rev_8_21_14_0_10_48_15]